MIHNRLNLVEQQEIGYCVPRPRNPAVSRPRNPALAWRGVQCRERGYSKQSWVKTRWPSQSSQRFREKV
jgi:hypothetical protein